MRVTIRDARYMFGAHVVNHVQKVEPVQVWHDGVEKWLVWLSNRTYELLDFVSLNWCRDDGTPRPIITDSLGLTMFPTVAEGGTNKILV